MVCEDTSPTHGRQGQQVEAVGRNVKCWANRPNAIRPHKCCEPTAVVWIIPSMSLQSLLGPALVQLPAGAQLRAPAMGLFFAQI